MPLAKFETNVMPFAQNAHYLRRMTGPINLISKNRYICMYTLFTVGQKISSLYMNNT